MVLSDFPSSIFEGLSTVAVVADSRSGPECDQSVRNYLDGTYLFDVWEGHCLSGLVLKFC